MTFKPDYNKKYALAVSGGVDSMCLLHMFASLCPRPSFFVVTVNHGIRHNAADDCKFVQDYCDKLGVRCFTYNVDVPTYAEQNKLSEETAARILRYRVLDEVDADYVCLAHQMSDQAETVLMHILRGSGVGGAAGMRVQNGKYLRPLLDMTRQDICNYATSHDVPFVNDSTNECTDYTRNYIRRVVMPELQAIFPRAEHTIARFADSAAQDNDCLNNLADISTVTFFDDGAKIPLSLLTSEPPVSTRVLRKVFVRLGVYCDVEKRHIDALIALSKSAGGKKLNLSNGFVAYNDYDCITLLRDNNVDLIAEKGTLDDVYDVFADFCVPFCNGVVDLPDGKIVVSDTPTDGALRVDLNKIPHGAVVRYARGGEVFTKFGGGTKPLRRYLMDKKVPQRIRGTVPLVTDGNEVLIVCGVEISDKVRVEEGSHTVYVKFFREEK